MTSLAPRSLPLLLALSLLAGAPGRARAACTLSYGGGPLVSSLQVVQVEWGASPPSYASALPAFYGAVLDSPFMDLLVQYDVPGQQLTRGAFVGRYAIAPTVTATTVDDTQVQAELARQIAAGKLPAPQYDAQGRPATVYMIEFPTSVTITLQGAASCQAFCSYHSSFTSGGKLVLYGVHPDVGAGPCAGGCGTGTPLQDATMVHSHNIAEVVTDPDVGNNDLGWYSASAGCGEIGDICNAQTATVAGYTVQKEWSNRDAACVAQPSTPVPICDGTNASSCRPCVPADAGQACAGATPACDASATSATFGRCVVAAAAPSHGGGGGCASGGGAGILGLLVAGFALRRRRD